MNEPLYPAPAPTPEGEDVATIRQRVKGTNINEQTLLATDYLNHFNEIVMLLEMIPDMPDLLEDAKEWAPKSYQQHFQDSAFSDKDLAIAAYEIVPAKYRVPFEETVAHMDRVVAVSLSRIEKVLEGGDPDIIRGAVSVASRALQKLIDVASAIIHGAEHAMSQDQIDELLLD